MKDTRITPVEWQAIYTSVYREYKRAFARKVDHKMLDDGSAERWLMLLKKIEAHLELTDKDEYIKSRN